MKQIKIALIDQFNQLKEKKIVKKNQPKGPVDIKELRKEVKNWNAKNRRP